MKKKLLHFKVWLLPLLFALGSLSSSAQVITIGTGTSFTGTSSASPLSCYYEGNRMQIIFTASELAAAGITEPSFIDSIAFHAYSSPLYALPNYKVNVKTTSATTLSAISTGGFTEVFTASSIDPAADTWQWFVFTTPYFWNGSDNLMIDICNGPASNWNGSGQVYYTTTTGNTVYSIRQDDVSLCGATSGASNGATNQRPNTKFGYHEAEDCAGTPSAGTISGVDSICGSTAFALSASGTLATGLTHKWQSSPAGDGTWTDIAGATGGSYSSAGITESMDYRKIITCTESGLSDTSDVFTVIKKEASECYCTPTSPYTYFSGCSYYRIDNFSTTGGVNNISNINSNCAGSSAYDNNTTDETMVASQWQGSVINFTIKNEYVYGTSNVYTNMWVDWNQDGVFSSSELVYDPSTTSPTGTDLTGSFEVPSTATGGMTRLRIMMSQGYDITGACSWPMYASGEVEDYNFEVLVPDPCSEVDMTAITLGGVDSICSGDPFTVTATGTPIASGLTRVWEKSPAGDGTWTVIAGATSTVLNVTGITEATDYRFTVTCEETGEEVISDTWTVDINPPTECYCIPSWGYGCLYGYNVNNFWTEGAITDISNLASGCSGGAGGYSDYRDMVADAYQGTIVEYNIGLGSTYLAARMWIDWDQNGTFDSDEVIYSSSSTAYAPTSISGSFEVPYDAVPGPTGLRVRTWSGYGYDYYGPCYDYIYGYGETEDYTFNVVEPDPCDEVPFTGLSIEGPETVCSATGFTITSEGTPIATGLTRIWQTKTDGGAWTTITGATSLNYTVSAGITDTTSFRYIVTCTLTGESDTSNTLYITLNPPTECYCIAEFSYAYYMDLYTYYDYKIKDVIINGQTDTLQSLNTPFPFDGDALGDLGGYTDYTVDTPELHIPDLVQTGTYSGKITVRYTTPYLTNRVWIDYDDDGFFEASESIHTTATTYPAISSAAPDNFTFTIAADAPPGLHRMRVRTVYVYATPSPSGGVDPCTTYTYGQTQDYMVEVKELKPCNEVVFPESATPFAWPPNVCGTGDIELTLTEMMPLAAGITYQWKSSSTETGTYTNVGTPIAGILGPDTTITGVSVDTWFKCYILCEGEELLISDALLVQSVDLDEVEITVEDGQTCGPGPVTLHGNTTDGSVFWYTSASGGSPIAMGDSFVTPSLTADAVYYATGGAFGASDGIVGTGTGSSYYYYYGPFTPYYGAKTLQMLYTAAELEEAGLSAGSIESVAFNCSSIPGTALANYKVYIKTSTSSTISWQPTGWTLVYSTASLLPDATGWVTFPFDSPFDWNGTDGLMVKVCFTVPGLSYYYEYTTASTTGGYKYTNKSGRSMYSYNSTTSTEACDMTYGYTQSYVPNAKFFIPGCETDRVPVNAYVRPVPAAVNIGDDLTTCKDLENGWTLDVGALPETYTREWDNGETGQTRRITESGTYSIEVANEYGCAVYDTVNMTLLNIPEVELGPDTLLCEGGTVTLDAGDDGTNYMWSTGESTPTIEADEEGRYTVVVENANDCIAVDTIDVTISGHMPGIASIVVTNTGAYSFNFEPLLPSYVVTYEWDFGDGATSSEMAPTHTYTSGGSYVITLTVHSTCGTMVYTTTAHIVGVNNVSVDNDLLSLYPNPAHETATIESKGDLLMKSITVTNILGQVMYHGATDHVKKHQLNLSGYASGVYNVRIETDKGFVVRKFEIIK